MKHGARRSRAFALLVRSFVWGTVAGTCVAGCSGGTPAASPGPAADPAAFARYLFETARAGDRARFAATVLLPPPTCAELVRRISTRPIDRVCREYEHNIWQSFDGLVATAAGPLTVHGVWQKHQGESVPAVMVETTYPARSGGVQALKVELLPQGGRFYLFSLHLTGIGCLGQPVCR